MIDDEVREFNPTRNHHATLNVAVHIGTKIENSDRAHLLGRFLPESGAIPFHRV